MRWLRLRRQQLQYYTLVLYYCTNIFVLHVYTVTESLLADCIIGAIDNILHIYIYILTRANFFGNLCGVCVYKYRCGCGCCCSCCIVTRYNDTPSSYFFDQSNKFTHSLHTTPLVHNHSFCHSPVNDQNGT